MNRYVWSQVSDDPEKHQLFDSVTKQSVAEIHQTMFGRECTRSTYYFLHSAHPARGTAASLDLAKIAIVQEMND